MPISFGPAPRVAKRAMEFAPGRMTEVTSKRIGAP